MNRPIKGPRPNPEDNPNPNERIFDDSNESGGVNNEDTNTDFDGMNNLNLDTFDDNLFSDLNHEFSEQETSLLSDDFLSNSNGLEQHFNFDEEYTPPPIPPKNAEREIKEEYKYEYNPDRSYLFIFGPPSAGKTVLIGSIIKYLKTYRSQQYGDTLKNKNNPEIKHEYEGNRLWRELTEANIQNKFPKGTDNLDSARTFLNLPVPRHINLHFHPASSHPDFEFCFMDLSGEDCSKVDYESGGKLHWSIRTYLEDVPKNNMCFIYVIDPKCEDRTNEEQTTLFEAFIDTLDANEHTSTPLLILVSKWDLYKTSYPDVEVFLKSEFEDIWGVANQTMRKISVAEFSIGNVEKERNEKIISFDSSYPERVFNWFYKTQTGHNLLTEHGPTPGLSLWGKILAWFGK
jgi:GTPase SAR1 family protein